MIRVGAALLALVAGCANGSASSPKDDAGLHSTRAESPRASLASAATSAHSGETNLASRSLASARIISLTPVSEGRNARAGTFDATLADNRVTLAGDRTTPADGSMTLADGRATLAIALRTSPIALRRPLAFARLASAIGAHVVPVTAPRAISAGEIGALLAGQPAALAAVRAEASVQNDGTIDALLAAAPPRAGAREIDPRGSFEVERWEREAASPVPVEGENPALLRDFVEMLALDYLAAFPLRRSVVFLPEAGALVLDDNRDAFSQHPDPAAILPLLRRLRGVLRFPRGLRDALLHLDRARASAIFAPGAFDTWILSPRNLVELDERRASLLSLIEAEVADRGEAAVLCL